MASASGCPPEPAGPVQEQTRPLPFGKRGRPATPQPLTEEQRQFAAENHNLIYTYLWNRRLEVDDYYDIAVFGYLRAVKRYLTEPRLRRYQFSTVAWHSMRQSVTSFHRAEERRRETERKYLKTLPARPPDPFEELEAKLLLHDLATVSSQEQYDLASMRLQGLGCGDCPYPRYERKAGLGTFKRAVPGLSVLVYLKRKEVSNP